MSKRRLLYGITFFAFVALLLNHLWGGSYQQETRFSLNTFVTVMVPSNKNSSAVLGKVFARFQSVDDTFSTENPSSPVYKFNHNQQRIITHNEIVALALLSKEINRLSEGAFDITLYPLSKKCGYMAKIKRIPSAREVEALRRHTGFDKLIITSSSIQKRDPDVQIDFGGIAKGYAVGKAADLLREAGVNDALINAGGNIVALGHNHGRLWHVGVKHPRKDGLIDRLAITNQSVSTSGDYERFFMIGSTRIHHILDPKTGRPANSGLISVTVITPHAALGDVLSTAVFVLGKEKGIALLRHFPEASARLVEKDLTLTSISAIAPSSAQAR